MPQDNNYGIWNVDAQLRALELAQADVSGSDLVMLVENAGTPVVGESERKFPDAKPRLDLCGYSWGVHQPAAGTGATAARVFGPLAVVRRVDSATASLASLFYARAEKLKVLLSVFRAGGDKTAADTLPMFEIELADAVINGQYLVTGGTFGLASEIVLFHYRSITLRSAAQKSSGSRGAVRECVMSAAPPNA